MTNTTTGVSFTVLASQWEVVKYGQLIERSDIESGDVGFITTKIYKYQGRFYVELWDNGYCIHFSEVID